MNQLIPVGLSDIPRLQLFPHLLQRPEKGRMFFHTGGICGRLAAKWFSVCGQFVKNFLILYTFADKFAILLYRSCLWIACAGEGCFAAAAI